MSLFLDNFGQITAFSMTTGVVLGGGLAAAFARNVIHAAFALFFTLLGMAGYYFLMGADFLGITQVIIYVGGIMVLLLYGVLLTSRTVESLRQDNRMPYVYACLIGAGVLLLLVTAIVSEGVWLRVALPEAPAETAQTIGELLLTNYLFVFEFSSVTLLMALVGAAYLVRKREN